MCLLISWSAARAEGSGEDERGLLGDLLHRPGGGLGSRTTACHHLPKAQVRKQSHKLALGFKSRHKADTPLPVVILVTAGDQRDGQHPSWRRE